LKQADQLPDSALTLAQCLQQAGWHPVW